MKTTSLRRFGAAATLAAVSFATVFASVTAMAETTKPLLFKIVTVKDDVIVAVPPDEAGTPRPEAAAIGQALALGVERELQCLGVERQVVRGVHHAKAQSGIPAHKGDVQHLCAENDLANIDGADSSPDFEHAYALGMDSRIAAANAAMPVLIWSTVAVTNDRRSVLSLASCA